MKTTPVDLLLHGAQLLTCASANGAKRGPAMRELGVIANGAVAARAGRIVEVGATPELLARYAPQVEIDVAGRAVCPGFVDPHTHVAYAGDRVDEFERRLRGESYEQIMAAGGGILSTVRATRAASQEQIVEETRDRLDQMLQLGITTVEAKTGYGLDAASELKLLRAIEDLDRLHAIDLVPTFMAAHAVAPEFERDAGAYLDRVVEEMLPAAVAWHAASSLASRPLFADVFCERHAFDAAQTRQLLQAAKRHGLPVKAHVDQFNELGGLEVALDCGAVSVDHLDVTGAAGIGRIARSATVAVVIPTASFNLGAQRYADARALIDAGAALALTTDINPGSSPCPSLQFAMALACRYQQLTPAEALNAATINAAHAIGIGDRTGSLEAGKQADLLVLETPDYRALMHRFGGNGVAQVIKNGRVVH